QPPRLRDPEWPDRLRALGADVAVVVAFGQILPAAVLDAPRRGSINVHGSLLPRYRGAAPIQWAIMRGETITGITTFQMDAGMDTGPMLLSRSTTIGPAETAGELAVRLAALGADVLVDTLARLDALTPTPQPHADATLAPRLKRTDGYLDWHRPARELGIVAAPRRDGARRGGRPKQTARGARAHDGPSRSASPAREAAARVLERVETDASFADNALETELTSRRLEPRDAALATELAYGT